MKLPNANQAIVEIGKLQDYCLSPTHFRGKNKARVFQSALGLTVEDAIELRAALLDAALTGDAVQGISNVHGTRFIIDFELAKDVRTAYIRSCWIVATEDAAPRLLTCYVL